ncbi:hypothetical protein [Paracoccus sp. (in: a-proteobacteria)]|uniref:HTH-like domain-containing protein n=1 Tax=Paracoccus sp. TaxID=267 RepID=UPI0035AEA910
MTFEQLTKELRARYDTADKREVVLAIHLFGIQFADALEGHSINAVAEAATGHGSYGTEIRKGMRLSKHVVLKSQLG